MEVRTGVTEWYESNKGDKNNRWEGIQNRAQWDTLLSFDLEVLERINLKPWRSYKLTRIWKYLKFPVNLRLIILSFRVENSSLTLF